MPKRSTTPDNPAQQHPSILQFEYIRHAAWFYYRAVGDDENLVSALERNLASQWETLLHQRSIRVPDAQEIYGYAQEKWREDQLHPAPSEISLDTKSRGMQKSESAKSAQSKGVKTNEQV